MNERLVAFLYVLLRDETPAGHLEELVAHVEQLSAEKNEFDNPHLAAYARELAQRLLASGLTCQTNMCNTPEDDVQMTAQGPLCGDCRKRYLKISA